MATRTAVVITVAVAGLLSFYFIRWSFVNAVADNGLDPRVAEARSLAEWLPDASPADPQAHLAAARYFERTFDQADLDRAIHEYETAAAAAPNDLNILLFLARAKDRVGDTAGAEAAYRRAYDLAPNYASVKWAYGNSLLRHGRAEQGFRLVAAAAHADQQYRGHATVTALQVFDGDPDSVRRALGEMLHVDATLADVFASQKRFTEAANCWARIPADSKATSAFQELGQRLIAAARAGNEFRFATTVAADLVTDDSGRPAVGKLVNADFESGIKLREPSPFEWNIAEGTEPQIGLSEGVRRSGRYSLFLTFNSFESANSFRPISQLVAVEPDSVYEFSGFYRADLKTKAIFRWEVVEAMNAKPLAAGDELVFAGDWTTIKIRFTVPKATDGVVIRFVRQNCGSGACPVTGRMAFDDLSLTRISG